MNDLRFPVFRPRDGSILDLKSLQILAATPSDMLRADLAARWPGAQCLILEGLELEGSPSSVGPPGSVRPNPEVDQAIITKGSALIGDRRGRVFPVRVPEPLHVPWPDATGPRVRGVLVLHAESVEAGTEDGLAVAHDEVVIRAGFVKPELASQPHLLQIAAAVGNGRDWATDIARILQPEHSTIKHLLKRFERLEQSVWKAEPEGSVWDRQVLGRSWVRYQTVAAAALQGARMVLCTHATTTQERIRLLTTLREQLEQSVERVATELLQILGPIDGAGPYKAVVGGRE